MRSEDVPVVRNLPLFADIGDASFSALMNASYLQRFPPQVELISEGDVADFLHIVIEGSVQLFATAHGRETTIDIVRPVTTFILAAVVTEKVYLMSGRSLETSRILMIPADNVCSVLENDPVFARSVIRELSSRYRTTIRAVLNVKLRTAVERLANYLLQQNEMQGGSGTLTLPIDKRTLASFLGMTPENLSRAFGTLGPYGVEVSGPKIQLTKPEDLTVLAKPHPQIDGFDV
jgi:CRP/FNR family transcriptional activator FtrB